MTEFTSATSTWHDDIQKIQAEQSSLIINIEDEISGINYQIEMNGKKANIALMVGAGAVLLSGAIGFLMTKTLKLVSGMSQVINTHEQFLRQVAQNTRPQTRQSNVNANGSGIIDETIMTPVPDNVAEPYMGPESHPSDETIKAIEDDRTVSLIRDEGVEVRDWSE